MQLIKELCIQNLINKLVLLVTIISGGQLVQTICSIRVFDIKRIDNKITISIRSATKQIKTKKARGRGIFEEYDEETKLRYELPH